MVSLETVERIRLVAEEDKPKTETAEGFRASGGLETDYDALFGRDGLLASKFRILTATRSGNRDKLLKPVKDTLHTLAAFQGTKVDTKNDEEPGKILHERRYPDSEKNKLRLEELRRAGWPVEEILHYFGSVDSTPLFVDVACEYFLATGDHQFFSQIDRNVRSALNWLKDYGDVLGDGFIRFSAKNRHALLNQGWMDSFDSLEVEGGRRPREPIALVEVQAYAFSAYKHAAEAYKRIGDEEFSKELFQRAGLIKERFNNEFWMEDEGYFASGLDANNRQITAVRSSPGHAILSGIIDLDKFPRMVKRIMEPDLFTPYGIRTLSSESRFFRDQPPGGYHNGGIWPHDNGLIYLGLKKWGFIREAIAVRDALLGAQYTLLEEYGIRNPELYMADRSGKLIPYDTAQHPQTWAREINDVLTNPLESEELDRLAA